MSINDTITPNNIIHTGAYWKKPVVENLGNKPRKISVSGFIDSSSILGGISLPLLKSMILAPGSGFLTLPDLGVLTVCVDGDATFNDSVDTQPLIMIELSFVEVQSPLGLLGNLLSGSIPDAVGGAIADAENNLTNDFGSMIGSVGL
jgi:hypothetical protein